MATARDATCRDIVRRHPALHLIKAQRGRAAQMNAGAAAARSDILLFLHADARLPPQALSHVRAAIMPAISGAALMSASTARSLPIALSSAS